MKTNGITNLDRLIAEMKPVLHTGEFVFVTVPDATFVPRDVPVCEIKEKEGTTLVLPKQEAVARNLPFEFVTAWITLNVHSSLEAVGLTAAFSNALANAGISCNVIAGYYHDHIFVDTKDQAKAMAVLQNLATAKRKAMLRGNDK